MQYIDLLTFKGSNDLCKKDHTVTFTRAENSLKNPRLYYEKSTIDDARLFFGRFCSVAIGTSFYLGGNHNYKRATTWLPFSLKTDGVSKNFTTNGDIIIGNDVWIGDNATILSGVSVGNGAVIGCNSLITKDVEPYTIVGGNPAKPIRKRFTEDVVKKFEKYQWWNLKENLIIENSHLLFSEDLQPLFLLCEEKIKNKEKYYIKYDE